MSGVFDLAGTLAKIFSSAVLANLTAILLAVLAGRTLLKKAEEAKKKDRSGLGLQLVGVIGAGFTAVVLYSYTGTPFTQPLLLATPVAALLPVPACFRLFSQNFWRIEEKEHYPTDIARVALIMGAFMLTLIVGTPVLESMQEFWVPHAFDKYFEPLTRLLPAFVAPGAATFGLLAGIASLQMARYRKRQQHGYH